MSFKQQLLNPGLLKSGLLNLGLALLFSHNAFAAHTLPEFTAKYAIEKFGIKLAEARYQLSHTETGYKFTQNTELYGFAVMFRDDSINAVSYVDDVNGTLLLKQHSYKQTGKEKNKDEDISIQWDTSNAALAGTITGMVRSKKIQHQVTTPVWEVLSFQLPLMIEADIEKKIYPYNAIIKGEVDTYNFALTSQEEIQFADQSYQTLHMLREDPNKDRQLHLWLAPDLHNIPMVIENYRDGKKHSRMRLESVQFNDGKTLSEMEVENFDDF